MQALSQAWRVYRRSPGYGQEVQPDIIVQGEDAKRSVVRSTDQLSTAALITPPTKQVQRITERILAFRKSTKPFRSKLRSSKDSSRSAVAPLMARRLFRKGAISLAPEQSQTVLEAGRATPGPVI